ncbi:hypothetical protein L0Y49_04990 [bacterium]|nr:hypothetical protein [bacterium]MCI0679996.1 hypothetical protein [bacterium]
MKRLDHVIDEISKDISALHRLVADAVEMSVVAIMEKNTDIARTLKAGDSKINELTGKIFHNCLAAFVLFAPKARDAHFIYSAGFVALDELERIADYAKGTAKQAKTLPALHGDPANNEIASKIHAMHELCADMLKRAVESYLANDIAVAQEVVVADSAVDNLVEKFNASVIDNCAHLSTREKVDLIKISHNFERIADRATNVAEKTVFDVTSKLTI